LSVGLGVDGGLGGGEAEAGSERPGSGLISPLGGDPPPPTEGGGGGTECGPPGFAAAAAAALW